MATLNNALGGYLEGEASKRQAAAQSMQMGMGLLNALRQQQALRQQSEMAPLQRALMEAQVGRAEADTEQRKSATQFQQTLPALLQAARRPDGSIDYGAFANSLMSSPGGLQMGMQLRHQEENRARLESAAKEREGNKMTIARERIDAKQEADRQRAADRENMMRAAAAGRPAPGAQPITIVDPNDPSKLIVIDARTRTKLGDAPAGGIRGGDAPAGGIRGGGAPAGGIRGGGAPGGKLKPFKFSVGGKNFAGSRDDYGNVFTSDGRPVPSYDPEITAADQKQAADQAAAQEATSLVERNLSRMEDILLGSIDQKTGRRPKGGGSAAAVAGPFSGPIGALQYAGSLFGGSERPGVEFSQLVESTLNSIERTGKLSNQQKNELRNIFKTGTFGDVDSVLKGIELVRGYAGIRGASAATPVGRPRPTGAQPDKKPDPLGLR